MRRARGNHWCRRAVRSMQSKQASLIMTVTAAPRTEYPVLSLFAAQRGTQEAAESSGRLCTSARAGSPTSEVDRWRLIRRLDSGGRFDLFRAAAQGDLGPGCYVLRNCRGEAAEKSVARAMLLREVDVAGQV